MIIKLPDRNRWMVDGKDKNYVADGIIDEMEWRKVSPRILFVMKEPNDPDNFDDCDLRKILRDGALGGLSGEKRFELNTTWPLVARWARGILDGFLPWMAPGIQEDFLNHEVRAPWLRKIAVINLKKSGGSGTTEKGSLRERTNKYRKALRAQIREIDPDIIICAGTGTEFWNILYAGELDENRQASNGVYFDQHKVERWSVVSYYHPQARMPHNFLYTMLVDALKEILAEQR